VINYNFFLKLYAFILLTSTNCVEIMDARPNGMRILNRRNQYMYDFDFPTLSDSSRYIRRILYVYAVR